VSNEQVENQSDDDSSRIKRTLGSPLAPAAGKKQRLSTDSADDEIQEDEVDDPEDIDEDVPATVAWTEWVCERVAENVVIPEGTHGAPPPPPPPPRVSKSPQVDKPEYEIHLGQKVEADGLMKKIEAAMAKSGKSFDDYDRFELLIQNPNLLSLYNQNVSRLKSFIRHCQKDEPRFFQRCTSTTCDGDGANEQLVVNTEGLVNTNHKSSRAESKCDKLRDEWIRKIERDRRTLFLVVHDEAHYEATKGGGADKFVNHDIVRKSSNVITLFVSATPYNLLTGDSQIPVDNIHAWKYDESSVHVDSDMKYFGLL
jgi:hypothetical protein